MDRILSCRVIQEPVKLIWQTGLGIKAFQEGYKVLFTTVSRLLTQVRECRSQKILRTLENRFEKFDLVVSD